ncbi:ricin-type beta-trefoil lectin domain protein [Streptomyces zaomyceticus]|uniref:ricin-type beta-trefoil lectin domain protein n=1 Tax=Streptomyces zaomyceticus TaxID=68286 RepID=UPI00368F6E3A
MDASNEGFVSVRACTGTNHQKWDRYQAGYVKNRGNGQCLDGTSKGDPRGDDRAYTRTCMHHEGQKWAFRPFYPHMAPADSTVPESSVTAADRDRQTTGAAGRHLTKCPRPAPDHRNSATTMKNKMSHAGMTPPAPRAAGNPKESQPSRLMPPAAVATSSWLPPHMPASTLPLRACVFSGAWGVGGQAGCHRTSLRRGRLDVAPSTLRHDAAHTARTQQAMTGIVQPAAADRLPGSARRHSHGVQAHQ